MRKYGFKGRIISFEPLPEAHVKFVKNSRKEHGCRFRYKSVKIIKAKQ
ncbi:MAG: hypothetical protein U9R17_04140 [Thermodesulfobacteriota bacterium]|nr:hypothetical protein [Thermodesulfobacteriota bacterium]